MSETGDRVFSGPELPPEPAALKAPVLSFAIALLAVFLFAWLAENVVDQHTAKFDAVVRSHVHEFASPLLTRTMFAVSFMGSTGLIISALVVLSLFAHFRWRGAAIWLLVTLAGALVLDLTLKLAFHRARPTAFFGPIPKTYSFPSGHSLFSFCFYGVLAGLVAGRTRSIPVRILLWALAAVLVVAIGISRIYLGVHYPSDVVAGYLVGTIWTASMIALDRVRQRRRSRA